MKLPGFLGATVRGSSGRSGALSRVEVNLHLLGEAEKAKRCNNRTCLGFWTMGYGTGATQ